MIEKIPIEILPKGLIYNSNEPKMKINEIIDWINGVENKKEKEYFTQTLEDVRTFNLMIIDNHDLDIWIIELRKNKTRINVTIDKAGLDESIKEFNELYKDIFGFILIRG